jgi:flagellar basal-body rod modification protein FlgD
MTISSIRTPLAHAAADTNAADDKTSSDRQPSNITANDFLTLLVTEMKNQDPTNQTDPNQYINQLVQVNSLQQLIEINENLASALGGSGDTSAHRAPVKAGGTVHMTGSTGERFYPEPSESPGGTGDRRNPGVSKTDPIPSTPGNVGMALPGTAAQGVAHALSGSR